MKKGVIVKIIIAAILIVVGVFGCVYNVIFCYKGDLKYLGYRDLKVNVTSVRTTEIEGKTYYQAFFNYEIDNTSFSYSSDLTSDSSKYIVDKEFTIRYNPKNPTDIFIKERDVVNNYLYLGISCVISIIGIKLFDKTYREG